MKGRALVVGVLAALFGAAVASRFRAPTPPPPLLARRFYVVSKSANTGAPELATRSFATHAEAAAALERVAAALAALGRPLALSVQELNADAAVWLVLGRSDKAPDAEILAVAHVDRDRADAALENLRRALPGFTFTIEPDRVPHEFLTGTAVASGVRLV